MNQLDNYIQALDYQDTKNQDAVDAIVGKLRTNKDHLTPRQVSRILRTRGSNAEFRSLQLELETDCDPYAGKVSVQAMLTIEEALIVDRTAELMGGVTRRKLLVTLCRDYLKQRGA